MSEKGSELKLGTLGFKEALATAVGLIIASSVLLTATQGFGAAGGTFVIAIIIAFVIMLCQSASFAEMSGIMPTSGAVYDYIASGLGRFWAIVGTLAAYLLVHVFAGTAETIALSLFAQVNFPILGAVPYWLIGAIVVLVFAVINYIGIDLFGRVELIMTAFMWLTLMIFSVIGFLKAPVVELDGFFGTGGGAPLLPMIGLAMFLFVGVEYVTPLAPELKEPRRIIPRALFLGITMVAIAMFLYGAAIARQVPNEVLDPESGLTLFDTPLPIPLFAESVMGQFGVVWLGLATLLAGCATINTILAGLPRILYGMAKDGTFPALFGKLHPRYKTPVNGIILATIIPIVGAVLTYIVYGELAIDGIITLVLAGVCAWIFSYILVNVSVIMLRQRRPEIKRYYKTPFYPIPQIVGSIGMALTLIFIAPPGIPGSAIYIPFLVMLAVCAAIAFVYTRGREHAFTGVEPELLLAEESLAGD